MNHRLLIQSLMLGLVSLSAATAADDEKPTATAKNPSAEKVYGEWRIQIRPDRGADYAQLIERQGLPLFRGAGGRMIGWWNTVVGNLYEHVTIWEYDDMASFERAIAMLGKDDRFARFAAQRDPLLAGESNRFMTLAAGAETPQLPETAKYVVHERHRVALSKQRDYLKFATGPGLAMLKQHGFHPVGPWMTDVGNWSEITWLFRFDSLQERAKRMADFSAHPDSTRYTEQLNQYADEIVTQVLTPASFAPQKAGEIPAEATSLLPHLAEVAAGVYAAGFADRYRSANCGWFTMGDETCLVDLPRGVSAGDYLAIVEKTSHRPARQLVLTQWQSGDDAIVQSLLAHGVTTILTSTALGERLTAENNVPPHAIRTFDDRTSIGGADATIELTPCDHVASEAGAALYLSKQQVLFAGPLVTHGPRAPLDGSDTALWLEHLGSMRDYNVAVVVPGRGSWGGCERLERQAAFLSELRRQVGYAIAQGRPLPPLSAVSSSLVASMAWTPYDTPTMDDLEHVFRELAVPFAPFNGRLPEADGQVAHALVLIGDQPHEPRHIEEGLRPAFKATRIEPHFAVDVRALSAENLARVGLLIMLRDGLQRPLPEEGKPYMWMTDEQQQAVVEFVENGGGFLNLHNSMGIYPADGPYLQLLGGAYTGHGPLERFRIEVVDGQHPVTRGVSAFSVADEQHAPICDQTKVHLLLQSRSDAGKIAAAGWTRMAGRGRLCHLAAGHTRESLLHPMHQRLLQNAIRWCLQETP